MNIDHTTTDQFGNTICGSPPPSYEECVQINTNMTVSYTATNHQPLAPTCPRQAPMLVALAHEPYNLILPSHFQLDPHQRRNAYREDLDECMYPQSRQEITVRSETRQNTSRCSKIISICTFIFYILFLTVSVCLANIYQPNIGFRVLIFLLYMFVYMSISMLSTAIKIVEFYHAIKMIVAGISLSLLIFMMVELGISPYIKDIYN